MQPYEEADERIRRSNEAPKKILKGFGSAATSLGAGLSTGAALSRVIPLLSKYIPQDLATKGLSKIDPRFGAFIKKALDNGSSFDEIKDFIMKKAEGGEEEKEPAKEHRNIIEQYSPELHQFIEDQRKRGRSTLQAGAMAQNDPRFSNVINKIVKDHKSLWSQVLQSVYGADEGAQSQQQQPEQQPGQQPQGQMQGAQGTGQGQQALMAVLQKLQQARGS